MVERGGKVEPTDAAFQKIGAQRKDTPATRDAMLDMWVASLPSPAKDILQVVASHRGPIAIYDLSARLNLSPRGGHWNTGVSMLRSNDLIGTTPQGFELGQAHFESGPLCRRDLTYGIMRLTRGKLLPKLKESMLGIRVSLAGKNRFKVRDFELSGFIEQHHHVEIAHRRRSAPAPEF